MVDSYGCTQILNENTDEQFTISGYKKCAWKFYLTVFLSLLTCGILPLLLYWRPDWHLSFTHSPCSLSAATILLCKDKHGRITLKHLFFKKLIITENEHRDFSSASRTGILFSLWSYLRSAQCIDSINFCEIFSVSKANNAELNPFNGSTVCGFCYRHITYLWDKNERRFQRLHGLEKNVKCVDFPKFNSLSQLQRRLRLQIFGDNSVELGLTPIWTILCKKILTKFYIFQIFSCILWFTDEYEIYASCILLISAISMAAGVYETRKNEKNLKSLSFSSGAVDVYVHNSNNEISIVNVPFVDLVPGDIFILEQQMILPCDALLLNGNAIVNESNLTGESVPVTKTPILSDHAHDAFSIFDIKEHSRHVLFSGTTVIQTRYLEGKSVRAIAIRTGFNTLRGELLRSILYPRPMLCSFKSDVTKFIQLLSFIAFGGIIYTLVLMVQHKESLSLILRRCLDLITICVPPALPAGLQAGLVYAQRRLMKQSIFCISPNMINMAGSVDVVVFDKTGTLTEDGLDLKFVVPVSNEETARNIPIFYPTVDDPAALNQRYPSLLYAMASCHSLTKIHHELSGDPIDLKMFNFTQWELWEPTSNEETLFDMITPTVVRPAVLASTRPEIGIVKVLPFSSKLQRMSVIVRELHSDHFDLYCKGSPEKIADLSLPDTVPTDFNDALTRYTRDGYRVLAMGSRIFKQGYTRLLRYGRDELECNLTFLGLIVMENKLKPETEPVIAKLNAANIRSVVCTGDNLLTALSVSRDCGIIDDSHRVIYVEVGGYPTTALKFTYAELFHKKIEEIKYDQSMEQVIELVDSSRYHFALDGRTWKVIREEHPKILEKIAVRGTVFARMLPEQKQQLIEVLQEIGYMASMCGDGANDCGALKAATTGISLSAAEASVASPFTSNVQNISCVPMVISEGRCSLVTSFGVIKFICAYSLIQFISVIVLYSHHTLLSDGMFLYIDLGLLTPLVAAFSLAGPSDRLHPVPPPLALFSMSSFFSLLSQLALALIFQVFASIFIMKQPWYEQIESADDFNNKVNYIVSVIFIVSAFQYITESVVYSRGPPYRIQIFFNYVFLAVVFICSLVSGVLLFSGYNWLIRFMEIKPIPSFEFKLLLFIIILINCALMWIIEVFLFENLMEKNFCTSKIKHVLENLIPAFLYPREAKHRQIEEDIKRLHPDWPPISSDEVCI